MDAELIIILAAVAFSILSGINKSRKKKQQQQGSHTSQQQDPDDPWATIRKYIEDAREEEEDDDDSPVHATEHHVYERPRINEQPTQQDQNPYTATLNEYAKRTSEQRAGRSRVSTPDTKERITPATLQAEEHEDIMDDFDLRKAVIYSELLKPKFEEV